MPNQFEDFLELSNHYLDGNRCGFLNNIYFDYYFILCFCDFATERRLTYVIKRFTFFTSFCHGIPLLLMVVHKCWNSFAISNSNLLKYIFACQLPLPPIYPWLPWSTALLNNHLPTSNISIRVSLRTQLRKLSSDSSLLLPTIMGFTCSFLCQRIHGERICLAHFRYVPMSTTSVSYSAVRMFEKPSDRTYSYVFYALWTGVVLSWVHVWLLSQTH
jgi:hypothetical protein